MAQQEDQGEAGQEGPADDMFERVSSSRPKMVLLTSANRSLVTVGLLAFVFLSILGVEALGVTNLGSAVSASDPIETVFQALIGSIITGVTLVVTISQLVLSQELGAVGDQWSRMQNAMEFREEVEDLTGVAASPPEPDAFLRSITDTAAHLSRRLIDEVGADRDDETGRRVVDFAESVIENAQDVSDDLRGAQFGTFAVVSAALDFNYSWKIHQARRMRHAQDSGLSERAESILDRLIDALSFFGPAREHFKTLYFEWELINLSRGMVYLAVPALVVAVLSVLFLESASVAANEFLGVSHLAWLLAAAVTVSVSPFMLLLAYILRIVTVAKVTLAMGPFILRRTDRSHEIDWRR